jgi:hypothetical protein
MRRLVTATAVALCLAAGGAPAALATHNSWATGVPVTDAPSEQREGVLGLGSGFSSVEPYRGGQTSGGSRGRGDDDVEVVGALELDPFN